MTRSPQKIFTAFALIALLFTALVYGFFEARRFLQGPVITIDFPAPGSQAASPLIVRGSAKNISFITLNGRQIFVDDAGVFEETLTPSKGYTVLTVEVRDRFGRTDKKQLPVVIQ